ncbi:proline-rich extensin-like protein EPR1 isoform X3 [Tachysurus fulvidraco]|uniref:proline-rich extensin-like protein EPR1 isoform X3 n=1 Tax=Tachysurus fulvidraco TaxID=1234273 RepID=UPI001FED38C5|nr:proline-rich extensin-like protein EPR1 isoform X3 [Tachysurus fulvidraco]
MSLFSSLSLSMNFSKTISYSKSHLCFFFQFQHEETVHFVPATNTPDVPVNVYPEYSPVYQPEYYPEYNPEYFPVYYPEYSPEYNPVYFPEYEPVYYPEYNPEYYPEYNPVYQPEYYPEYQTVYCPEYSPVYQPAYYPELNPEYDPVYYPEYSPEYYQITNQDPNDGGQDIMVNRLLGGTAMYPTEPVSPTEPASPSEPVSPPELASPPKPVSSPKPVSPPETMLQMEPANTKFQPEETVHYVPAINTPDFEDVHDNLYPEYNPMYYPEYYQFLPPEFYPKPLKVETVEEVCFLSSPQPSHNHQPILPERKQTLITSQDPNDGGQDIMVNGLLGGTVMYPPESMFPPENVSAPQHTSQLKPVSPPKPASPSEPMSPPEHKPDYSTPNTKVQR